MGELTISKNTSVVMDRHLFSTRSPKSTVFWLPGNGRSIAPQHNSYRPFDRIVRTVHIPEALDICAHHQMIPKPIVSHSVLNRNHLRADHPCANLCVLWFGIKNLEDEEKHDWYGNVEFALPADYLLQVWKYCFLVEIMSTPTHTATRLLITNTDYSAVLSKYDPCTAGGPWVKTSGGNMGLTDCFRYNNIGYNKHGHSLEFMIEVRPFGQRAILENCEISFRNHLEANDYSNPHVCQRFQKTATPCPAPFAGALSSRIFFGEHARLGRFSKLYTPRLSWTALQHLHRYIAMAASHSIPHYNLAPAPYPVHAHAAKRIMTNINTSMNLKVINGVFDGNNHFQITCLAMRSQIQGQQSPILYWMRFSKKTEKYKNEDPAGILQNGSRKNHKALCNK
ncbi:uncharacterized protein [Procambarus clarkii]|uniref:uncharacterized protein n=1 Tax=Procambarus clarkii TaxID=6728 RepID=UPI001E678092|nr:uncharacterized protein LOC123761298 [Procambarus clarkii]